MAHSSSTLRDQRVGTLSAVGAFCMWGLLPLYWIQIQYVPALEVIWHRVFWGAIVAWTIVLWRRRRAAASGSTVVHAPPPLFPHGKTLVWLVANGVLLVANWFVYVWAVTSGRTLDASLGYYINPLVSVVLGLVFFGERLSRLQWVAVASATVGVVFLTVRLGVLPWASLALAFSFGFYGLIKKRSSLGSIHSLAVELTVVSLVAATAIVWGWVDGSSTPAGGDVRATVFLVGAGVVTVAPLLLFGVAAQRIRLSDVGFFQYIGPTLMFLIAITIFGDPLEPERLAAFAFVWAGLGLYTFSNYRGASRRRRPDAPE